MPPFPITDPVLIVAIAMAIFLLAPLLAQQVRLPGIIGLIVAGAVIGPNGLNLLARDQTIVLLGTVGLLYLLFMVGIEIDLQGFRRYRNRSLSFGAISFLVPQVVGIGVGLVLGYSLATSFLLGSMFGSHTLLAYPITQRFGIARNTAVTTAVGGTIVTDSSALLVLAVVVASTAGALDAAFWARLTVLLALFVAAVWYGFPRLARWFFRHEKATSGSEYVFVLTALFTGAYMARLAGLEPIVGAFLSGLALNRLIPEQAPLTQRIQFFGNSFFIPFFLLSIGMLVDVRVLLSGARAWEVMVAMTVTVSLTKLAAAQLGQRLFGYSPAEGWMMFGLTVPQAAATLAVALVGIRVGLLDDAALNGAIMMVLVTCVLGPWLVDRYGREIALQEQQKPYEPRDAPQRVLVPIANPATARGLLDVALLIRHPDSNEPIYPVTVVPGDIGDTAGHVALAERMLGGSVAYLSGAGVPVVPLTRVDENFARGIARGVAETRGTTIVVGWDGRPSVHKRVFGTVLDRLLEVSGEQILVTKLGHPLNTTDRLIVLVPRGSDHVPGFFDSVRTVKLMAKRLDATIVGFAAAPQAEPYAEHFEAVRPDVPATIGHVPDWDALLARLPEILKPDDLVVVIGARQGAVSWDPALDRLPGLLAALVPASFIMLYPAEFREAVAPPVAVPPAPRPAAVPVLTPQRILLDEAPAPVEDLVRRVLEQEFAHEKDGLIRVQRDLSRSDPIVAELRAGAAVAQARTDAVTEPLLLLARIPEGLRIDGLDDPVYLLFILISSRADAQGHLRALAEIGWMVAAPDRFRKLREASSPSEVLAAAAAE